MIPDVVGYCRKRKGEKEAFSVDFPNPLNHPNDTMTKEEVEASLERMGDDPDDWYGKGPQH
jgi:hypothetical protein